VNLHWASDRRARGGAADVFSQQPVPVHDHSLEQIDYGREICRRVTEIVKHDFA
jgi:hypothetical protein